MRIGEVASRTGFSTSAIRYYEGAGLLPLAPRRSGRRVYDDSIVERLQILAALQQAGFSLAEIRSLFDGLTSGSGPSTVWRRAAEAKLAEIDATLATLRRTRRLLADAIDCACEGRAEDCEMLRGSRTDSPGTSS